MSILRFLFYIGLFTGLVACSDTSTKHNVESDSTLTLRHGTLTLEKSHSDVEALDSIALDQEVIVNRSSEHLYFVDHFTHGQQDIVVFGSRCEGTACATEHYSILVLADNQPAMLIEHDDLYAYPNEIKVEQTTEGLTLNLGFLQGKQRYADLSGDRLSFRLEEAQETKLRDDRCEWLYHDGLGACVSAKEKISSCENPQVEFVGYLIRGMQAIAEQPGFVNSHFDTRCIDACKQGDRGDYESFAQAVCGF